VLLVYPKTGGMVRFVVRDTGRGIPAERHAEVFTPSLNIEVMRGIIENTETLRVVEAQTVHDGLEIARRLKPDVVITDIHLPDGKGFDVLAHLREDGETAHIPVIALTAERHADHMHNMQRAGFDRIVTKPFDVPEFVSIIRSTLKAAA
jgi:CheY-like chemotaxis protein